MSEQRDESVTLIIQFTHPQEIILLEGPESFVLAGQPSAPFPLCIEYPEGECCQTIGKDDLVAVSAPEGGPREPALMLLELVRSSPAGIRDPAVCIRSSRPGVLFTWLAGFNGGHTLNSTSSVQAPILPAWCSKEARGSSLSVISRIACESEELMQSTGLPPRTLSQRENDGMEHNPVNY
jgi:hypothetical protein